jgi:hypothetical protein
MKAVVIFESLTGHTRTAAGLIAKELATAGVDAVACPITQIDYQALSDADLVIVGTWTDGFVFVGQRPGRAQRLWNLPVLDGKRAFVFCTYAVNSGKVLDKMTTILAARGADVLGGMAIRRDDIPGGARDFVHRLVDSVEA